MIQTASNPVGSEETQCPQCPQCPVSQEGPASPECPEPQECPACQECPECQECPASTECPECQDDVGSQETEGICPATGSFMLMLMTSFYKSQCFRTW